MAEKTQNIYQKLNNFRGLVGAIRKDKENPYHKSKYADINTILEAITDKLSEAGLIDVDTTKIDENGQLWLETKLVNIDNPEEFLKIETPLLMKDKNNPQALGSALTYARRYNRVTLLGLEQEDDDGNAAAGNVPQTQQTYPKPKQTQQNTKQTKVKNSQLDTMKIKLSKIANQHGLPKGLEKPFAEFLTSKGYDVFNDLTHISFLIQNQSELIKFVNEFIETKLEKIAQ